MRNALDHKENLENAIKENDLEAIQTLLEEELDPKIFNERDETGNTLIGLALDFVNTLLRHNREQDDEAKKKFDRTKEIIKLLIENGAEDKGQKYQIIHREDIGDEHIHYDILYTNMRDALEANNANYLAVVMLFKDVRDEYGFDLFKYAIDKQLIDPEPTDYANAIIEAGLIDYLFEEGNHDRANEVLKYAIDYGQIGVVRKTIKRHFVLYDDELLDLYNNDNELLDLIGHTLDSNNSIAIGSELEGCLSDENRVEIIHLLMDKIIQTDNLLEVMKLCVNNHSYRNVPHEISVLKIIIDKINTQEGELSDEQKNLINSCLIEALDHNKTGIATLLIDSNLVDINYLDENNNTALKVAIENGRSDIAISLVARGAEIYRQNLLDVTEEETTQLGQYDRDLAEETLFTISVNSKEYSINTRMFYDLVTIQNNSKPQTQAFLKGTHPRVGRASAVQTLPVDILGMIIETNITENITLAASISHHLNINNYYESAFYNADDQTQESERNWHGSLDKDTQLEIKAIASGMLQKFKEVFKSPNTSISATSASKTDLVIGQNALG